jgi:hypothetical protein
MGNRPWLKQLRRELFREGLPGWYIDRLVGELADHITDCQQESASMDAQQACESLGTAVELAASARQEFDRRSFAGRHPILTFVVGPVACVPLLFVACMLLLFGAGWGIATGLEWAASGLEAEVSQSTTARIEFWAAGLLNLYGRFVPFALAAWMYCRIGRRMASPRWSVIACLITAAIALFVFTKSTPGTETSGGSYMIGLAVPPAPRQMLQLVPPLLIGAWFLWQVRGNRRHATEGVVGGSLSVS